MNAVLLEGRALSREFGGLKAVQDVGFEVRRGEIVGIIGPNGAGKTTMFNVVSRIYQPTGGSVLYRGQELLDGDRLELRPPHNEPRAVVGVAAVQQRGHRAGGRDGLERGVVAEAKQIERIVDGLAKLHTVQVERDPQAALLRLADKPFDVLVVSLSLQNADGLRLYAKRYRFELYIC